MNDQNARSQHSSDLDPSTGEQPIQERRSQGGSKRALKLVGGTALLVGLLAVAWPVYGPMLSGSAELAVEPDLGGSAGSAAEDKPVFDLSAPMGWSETTAIAEGTKFVVGDELAETTPGYTEGRLADSAILTTSRLDDGSCVVNVAYDFVGGPPDDWSLAAFGDFQEDFSRPYEGLDAPVLSEDRTTVSRKCSGPFGTWVEFPYVSTNLDGDPYLPRAASAHIEISDTGAMFVTSIRVSTPHGTERLHAPQ